MHFDASSILSGPISWVMESCQIQKLAYELLTKFGRKKKGDKTEPAHCCSLHPKNPHGSGCKSDTPRLFKAFVVIRHCRLMIVFGPRGTESSTLVIFGRKHKKWQKNFLPCTELRMSTTMYSTIQSITHNMTR